MANHKLDRITTEISRYVSQILLTEVEDEILKSITITDCEVTRDLSYATLYFSSFTDLSSEELENRLEASSHFIRGKLSSLIELRHTPQLRFKFDKTIAEGKKIESIIKKIHNN